MLLGGVIIFVVIALFVALAAAGSVEKHESVKIKRAQQNASTIAQAIARAVGFGIPLNKLSSVDVVFQQRLQENKDFYQISLIDSDNQVIQSASQKNGVEQFDRAVSVPIELDGKRIGAVIIQTSQTNWWQQQVDPILLGIGVWLAAMIAMYEALLFARRRGPHLRQIAFEQMIGNLAQGDFTQLVSESSGHALDRRPSFLSMQIRAANERYLRIRRLVASLMETEPSLSERTRLRNILAKATGDSKFAEGKPTGIRLSALPADARWILFLVASATGTLMGLINPSHGDAAHAAALSAAMVGFGVLLGLIAARIVFVRMAAQSIAIFGVSCVIFAPAIVFFSSGRELVELLGLALGCFGTTLTGCACVKAVSAARRDGEQLVGAAYAFAVISGGQVMGPLLAALHVPVLERTGSLLATALLAAFALIPLNQTRLTGFAWAAKEPGTLAGTAMAIGRRLWAGAFIVGVSWAILNGMVIGQMVQGLRVNSAAYFSVSIAAAGLGALIAMRFPAKILLALGALGFVVLAIDGEYRAITGLPLLLCGLVFASAAIWSLRMCMYSGWLSIPRHMIVADMCGCILGSVTLGAMAAQDMRSLFGEVFIALVLLLGLSSWLLRSRLEVNSSGGKMVVEKSQAKSERG